MALVWNGDEWVSNGDGRAGYIDPRTNQYVPHQVEIIQFDATQNGYQLANNKL